jgi:hypothetical protein
MRAYRCRVCGNPLFFENSVCVSCGAALGYSRAERDIVPLDARGAYADAAGAVWHVCRNLGLSGCTWLTSIAGGQCFGCDLTRTRPNDADAVGIASFPIAERAKRRLVAELDALGLPVVGKAATAGGDPANGLAFDLLSSVAEDVVIGHADGVVTIDLAEGDDAYREEVRHRLAEPYRTMLGHFRHEIGHYYEWQLVERDETLLPRVRALFGDERADYQEAIDRHYAEGAPAGWADAYISEYATMHPYEDFAETWAHVMHIRDGVETAVAYGLADPAASPEADGFRGLVTDGWMPLATALNMMNRSMGRDDLYPFVLAPRVLDKLALVAEIVDAAAQPTTG